MVTKICKKMLMSLVVISLLTTSVMSYYISPLFEDSKIHNINGAHIIQTNGNLDSRLWFEFSVDSNYSGKYQFAQINFFPYERSESDPIINFSVTVCDSPDSYGGILIQDMLDHAINNIILQ